MGRLTLNVLLSFAQFEREVTGERIRDKIAASKQARWPSRNSYALERSNWPWHLHRSQRQRQFYSSMDFEWISPES